MAVRLTSTGIANLGSLPWGTHLCQFYETGQDLLDVLVPYFRTGLENNEMCLWVTSAPLEAGEAREAMRAVMPQFDSYLDSGQMEIVASAEWYLRDGQFNHQSALDAAGNKIRLMGKRGFSGVRGSGNAGWLAKQSWEDFARYEEALDREIGGLQAMTICSYPIGKCGVRESLDVMRNHGLALVKDDGAWRVVENSGRTRSETARRQSEERYRLLADNVSDVVWVTDMNLKPIYFSPSVTRLLGYSVEEAMAGTIETRLTGPSFDAATDTFERLLELEKREPGGLSGSGKMELEFQRKDGSLVWVDATVTLLRDSRGRLVQILGVLHDISGRKAAEERLHHSMSVLETTMEGTIQAIASTVEMKDPYTAGHQRRVTQLACAIAREMGLPGDSVRDLRTAGLLHDLGKIALPTDILTKPGRLNELEFGVIRTHPKVAYDVLKSINSFERIAEIVLQHHERMDGSGYPAGLRGEDILLEARILAVADVIEAMSSYRPYRASLGLDKALEEVSKNSGVLYDRNVVRVCLQVVPQTGFEFGEGIPA